MRKPQNEIEKTISDVNKRVNFNKVTLVCKEDYLTSGLHIFFRGDKIKLKNFTPLENEEGKVTLYTGLYNGEHLFFENSDLLNKFFVRWES